MSDIFSLFSWVGVVIYFVSKHSETLAKLNKTQKIGVFISYILATLTTGISIYFGSSFLTKSFQNEFLIVIIRLSVVLITLGFVYSL
ncbi:hypothetical protein [Salipaludibacillus sp. CF4.18]|uniref:hypothetical protein n=1 Tax=Salipaludibacillus sp. CF4.18 TaxID=3373081 RepID=UPI003EE5538C